MFIPFLVFAAPDTNVATGVNEILIGIKSIEDGAYLVGVSLILMGLISFSKIPALWRIDLFARVPKRVRFWIPIGLGFIVTFLSKLMPPEKSWSDALYYLWTGPLAIIMHEGLVHSLGGKEHKK